MLRKINKSLYFLVFALCALGLTFCLPIKGEIKALAEKSISEIEEQEANSSNKLWASEIELNAAGSSDITTATIYGKSVRIIYTAKGLANVAYNVNSGTAGWADGIYVLANDINLAGAVWTPIGTASHPFAGTFLGEGHTVSNLTLDSNFADSSSSLGLFGNVTGGSIAELRIGGTTQVTNSRGTGNLVGRITNGELINCRDESTSSYDSVGNISNTKVFASSTYVKTNFSGATPSSITQGSDGLSTTTLSGVSNIDGYVVYYLADSNFKYYCNSSPWVDMNGERVRVIVDTNFESFTGTIKSFIFLSHLPSLRENLGVDDITTPYPLRIGYKATLPAASQSNSLVLSSELNWTAQTVNVIFDMGYGTRSGEVTFAYDMSYQEFLTSQNATYAGRTYNGSSYTSRVGYSLDTIKGSRGNNVYQNGSYLYTQGVDRAFYYGYPTSSADTVFSWTALEGRGFSFRFLMEYEDYSLGGIDYATLSNNFSEVTVSSGNMTTSGHVYQVSSLTAGQDVTITFRLNAGYQMTLVDGNNLLVNADNQNNGYSGDSDVFLSDKASGVYLNFANLSGNDPNYLTANVNNDNYNPVSVKGSASSADPKTSRTITITLSNLVGTNGNVFIVISRLSQDITVSTNIVTLLSDDQKIENSFTWTYYGRTFTQENFVVRASYNQNFEITFLIGASDNVASDYYVLSVETGNINSANINYNSANSLQAGINTYYKGFTITGKIDSLAETDQIKVNIGELRASVEMHVYKGDSEIEFNEADNKTKGISATINGQTVGLKAQAYVSLRSTQQDQIVYNKNGYFSPLRLEIFDSLNPQTPIVNTIFDSNNSFSQSGIFTTAYTGGATTNYKINIYVDDTYYNIDWSNFNFNIGSTTYNGGDNYDFLSSLFELAFYNGDESQNSFLPEQTMRVVLTMTEQGRAILYGDTSNFVVDNAIPDSASIGFASGVMTPDGSEAERGVWAFDYIVGTFDFDFTFSFEYKTLNLQINGLVLSDKLDVILNDSTLFTSISGSFAYSYNGSQVLLNGQSFGSLSIHTQYYLLGWYLANGNVLVSGNYLDITNSSSMIYGYMDISKENNSSTFTINVQAVVNQRTISLDYDAGNVGKGEIISSGVQEQILYYDTPVTLQSPFINKGHTFLAWSYIIGSETRSTNQSTFSLTDGDWSKVFGSNAANDMQEWSSFADNQSTQSASQTTLTLTATWQAINYNLIIDGTTYNNILQIGDEIRFVASGNKDGGGSYYIYRDGSQQGAALASGTNNGYLAVGFTIKESQSFTNAISGDYASFTFDGENFDKLLGEIFTQQKTLTITTEREAATYKVYVENSPYFTASVSKTCDAYGEDEKGVYVVVTFNKIPTVLDSTSSDYLFNSTSTSDKPISIYRLGYTFSGLFYNFDPKETFLTASDITLSPIWTRNSDETVQANISWMSDELQDIDTFYLLTSKEIISANLTDIGAGKEPIGINPLMMLSNGEQLTDYGFVLTYSDGTTQTITLPNVTVFNINSLYNASDYTIKFFVTVSDTLYNTQDATAHREESESLTFATKKNSLAFDSNFVSVYNQTSEFVPALESQGYENDNDYGRVYVEYNYDGQKTPQEERTYISVTEFFRSESFVLIGGDYSVGSGRDVAFNINTSYFSTYTSLNGVALSTRTNWANLINNVSISGSNYMFTYYGGATIVRAKFTVNFGRASTYYFDDTELIVYTHDGSNITFRIGSVDFTYTLTNIIYTGGYYDEDKTFTGEKNSDMFEVRGLKVSGQDYSAVSDSFEYVLEGQFDLLNSDNALKLSYSPRYLVAQNGQLSMLALDYNSQADNLYIDNILVGQTSVEATSSQFTYQEGNQVVFSFVNNNSPQLVIYINKAALSSYLLSFDIVVDISTDRLQSLTPLAWDESSELETYDSMLDGDFVDPAGRVFKNFSVSLATQDSATFAVLTDIRKVNIDYNGGHNAAGEDKESIYISAKESYVHQDPVHDYSGLEFAGYFYTCLDPVLEKVAQGYRFTTTDGGKSTSIVAQWKLVGVEGSQIKDSVDYYASLGSLSLNVADVLNLSNLTGGTLSYTLSNGKFTFTADKGIFTIQDETKRAPSTMSGAYTLTAVLAYQNSTQAVQTISREFTLNLNIQTNDIGLINETTNTLTFNNLDRKNQINIGVRQNEIRVEGVTLSALLEKSLNSYGVNLSITYDAQVTSQVRNAGRYTITLTVAEDYKYFFSLESGKETITQDIGQYKIDLSLYEEQITLSKDLGLDDPDLSSTITIAENANDQVVINFTREEGEAIGLYKLTNPTLKDSEDLINYVIDAKDFEDYFEILVPTANLRIDLDGTLSFVYNGNALTNLSVSYDSEQGKFVLTGYAGSQAVSQTFTMFYLKADGSQTPIPADAAGDFVRYVVFTPADNNSSQVGSYNFTVAFTEEGEAEVGQEATEPPSFTAASIERAKIVVTERTITVTSITKVLDQSTSFIWKNTGQDPNLTLVVKNIVDGDEITISGNFFQSYAGYQSITQMFIDEISDKNYQLAYASDLQVLVIPSQETIDVTTTTTTLVYGSISSSDELNAVLANIPLAINDGAINANYITIASFAASGEGVYSTGGHLRVGSRTIVFTLTSTNYTFGGVVEDVGTVYEKTYDITVEITAKELDLAGISSQVVKFYDKTDAFPDEGIDITNYGIEGGDNVYIDKTNSHYDDANVGTGKTVTIILGGSDSTNYSVLNTVTGAINQHSITFTVSADTEDIALVTDGKFVEDELSPNVRNNIFTFTYPNNFAGSQLISQMVYPTRIGYKAIGWKYNSEGRYLDITEDNIQSLIEELALGGESKSMLVYTVWEIETYSVQVRGNNIASYSVEGDFYDENSGRARYFSSLTISAETERGFKISSYNIASGTYRQASLTDTGASKGTATISNIGSAIIFEINASEIAVTFNLDDNLPLYTYRTDSNLLYETYDYSALAKLTQDNLATLSVTEGTYSFKGYTYGEANQSASGKTLKEIVDQLYTELTQDVQITLTAVWQGENYQISFNPNGGDLIGNQTINAVYGSEIQGLPQAVLPGRSFVWVDSFDVEYVDGDVFHTIGQRSGDSWKATLTAKYSNNPYTLTVVFDDKIVASVDGSTISSGTEYVITYDTNSVTITASAVQGYEFEFDTSKVNGETKIEGNVIQIYNLIDEGTLTIKTLLGKNRLSLGVQNIESYTVEIDGEKQSESLTEYEIYTESIVVITYSSIKGYEFDDSSVVFSTTSSSVSYQISEDKHTLTLTWKDFVDGITINVTANPSLNTITIPNISDRFTSLQFNGTSVSVNGTTYKIYSDTPLTLTATLRYGYMNGTVASSVKEFLMEGQTCSYTRSDGRYHLTASFENINDSFTLEFTSSERSYNFALAVSEGQEEYGEIVEEFITQTVSFNGELILQANVIQEDYIFNNWTGNNTALAQDEKTSITINQSLETLLESVDLGQTITIYANFIENLLDVTFTVGNRGEIAVSQMGISDFTVGGGKSVVVTTRVNADFIITLTADEGYELDQILIGGKPLAECGFAYTLENNVLSITPTKTGSFTSVEVTFKASDAIVHVQAAVQINYEFTYSTDLGGLVYISDETGKRLDDSLYLNADGTMYFDYRLLSHTDDTIYFTADINSGFNLVMSSKTAGVVVSEMDVGGIHIYAFSGIKDGTEIQAIFTARENSVEIKFVRQGSETTVAAGRISVDTASELVRTSQNNTSDVRVSAITGANLAVAINSQFGYNLLADESGVLSYSIKYLDGQFDENDVIASKVTDSDPTTNGYTKSASLQIQNVNADAIIYIYVEPKVYNLTFSISYGDTSYQVDLEDAIVFGETFSLANLSNEDRATIFTTREGYTLDGYYTKQAGQGVQYVDRSGNVLRPWTETGYTWNGTRYTADTNFDPLTQTFTIYAAWIYDKSTIIIDFLPEGFGDRFDDIDITDIIISISSDEIWTAQDNKWYAQVKAGSTIKLQAYEYQGYEFMSWEITTDSGQTTQQPSTFEMEFPLGRYNIKAVYYPKFTMTVNGNGGTSSLQQNGITLTGEVFSPDEIVTLVAKPNDGYNFLYWINTTNGERIYGTYDANTGNYVYSFESAITTPLNIVAMFEGKPVYITLDHSGIDAIHRIVGVYVDNVLVGYAEGINATIGQTLEIVISKAYGNKVQVLGGKFVENYNSVTGYYEYSLTLNASELEMVGESYSLNVVLENLRENINITFNISVQDAVDSSEYARAGSQVFVDASGKQHEMTSGNTYQILYGDSSTLRLYSSTNYTVYDIRVAVGEIEQSVLDRFSNGEITIDKSFLDFYEIYDLEINVVYKRMVWCDDEYRASGLLGMGTDDNPYFIRSAEEIGFVAYAVNNGLIDNSGIAYADAVYRVVADIDFYGCFWEPIGTPENPFNGKMYLKSYNFTNLTLYRDYSNPDVSYGGLFWCITDNAEIVRDTQTLVIVLAVIGLFILLILLILLLLFLLRKRRRKKMEEIANA